MVHSIENICPKCGARRLKSWPELSDEERFLAKRLAMSAEYTPEERKRHRFCPRCWFEDAEGGPSQLA